MKIYMVVNYRDEYPYDKDWDGPFISKEYIFTESIWADDDWQPVESNEHRRGYLYEADTRGWTSYIQEVEVEGS